MENVLATKHHDFVVFVKIDAADNALVYAEGLLFFNFFYHYLFCIWWQVIYFSFSSQSSRFWAQ